MPFLQNSILMHYYNWLKETTAAAIHQISVSYRAKNMTPEEVFAQAEQYRADQDWEEAFYWHLHLANDRHPESMNKLGVLHYNGQGTAKNVSVAYEWILRSAEAGYVGAMSNMAQVYHLGHDGIIAKDFAQAFIWYKRAAEAGHVKHTNDLGDFYHAGEEVGQDLEQAFIWHKKAAEAGYVEAMYKIAQAYHKAEGVEKDSKIAVEWYMRAALAGHVESINIVGDFYYDGNSVVERDFAQSVIWYQKAAASGHIDAMFSLGYAYHYGEGIEQNLDQAFFWYKKAAEKDHIESIATLADFYFNGYATDKNIPQSFLLYKKAAELGHVASTVMVGDFYYNGYGQTEKNREESVVWYQKAAEAGNTDAIYKMGHAYRFGQGVEKNLEQAMFWFMQGVDLNDSSCINGVGKIYNSQGDEEGLKYSVQWFQKAVELNNSDAMFNLAWCYQYGQGIEQNSKQAILLYGQSASAGHASAMNKMGDFYSNGFENIIEKDLVKSFVWYQKSAEANNINAMASLAYAYEYAQGVKEDLEQAFLWRSKAVENEHIASMHNLGLLYYGGKGTVQNLVESFKWFTKAAESGDTRSYYTLGRAYASGAGTKQDWPQAKFWYEKSAEAGSILAINQLAYIYFSGSGDVYPNKFKALEWYQKAADAGHCCAMRDIGKLLTHNPELIGDLPPPYIWFEKAAAIGCTEARFIVALYSFFMQTNTTLDIEQRTEFLKYVETYNPSLTELYFPNGLPDVVDDNELFQQLGNHYTIEDANQLLEEWKININNITEEKCLQVERVLEFYRIIEHPVVMVWDACWVLAKAKLQHDQTYADIQKSVQDTGPLYNSLASEGWIMPGKAAELNERRTGLVAASNVTINDGEAIVMGTVSDDPRIAMIFPEDVDVALILAFVEDPNKPVRPSFSLEPSLTKRYADPRADRFMKKEFFKLEWLAATDFGKTFYWTDYIMKEMGSNDLISLSDVMKKLPYDPEAQLSYLPQILTTLERQRFTSVDAPNVSSGRMMLTLGSVELIASGATVAIANPKMFIDSSQVSVSELGEENRSIRPNDPTTDVGADAKRFTDHYDEVAAVMPVFERLKQLLALYRACELLRKNGHTLGYQQIEALRKKRDEFVQKVALNYPNDKIQLVPKRAHHRSIICHGGVGIGVAEITPIRSQELRQAEEAQARTIQANQDAQHQLEIQRQRERQAQHEAEQRQRQADELRRQQNDTYIEAQRQADQAAAALMRANADTRIAAYELSRIASEQVAAEQHRTAQAQLEVARRQEIERQTREMPSVVESILRRQANFRPPSNDNSQFFNIVTTTPAPSINNEAAEQMEQRTKYLEAQGDAFEKSLESLQHYAETREEIELVKNTNVMHTKHIGIENGEYVVKDQYVEVPSGPNPLKKIPDGTIADPSIGAILAGVGMIQGGKSYVISLVAKLTSSETKHTSDNPMGSGGGDADIPGFRMYYLAP